MSTDGQGAATSRRLGALEVRRALWNREAQARLTAAGEDVLPAAVLTHALRSRWIPRTFRAAVDGYWRAHPLRAERLARGLASRSGTPAGWRWRLGPPDDLPASYRTPPLPFREPRSAGGGQCVHIEKSVTEIQSRNGSTAALGRPNPCSPSSTFLPREGSGAAPVTFSAPRCAALSGEGCACEASSELPSQAGSSTPQS